MHLWKEEYVNADEAIKVLDEVCTKILVLIDFLRAHGSVTSASVTGGEGHVHAPDIDVFLPPYRLIEQGAQI